MIRISGEDPPPITLQVTLFRPNGSGPFPLAIMNHGATNVSFRHRETRYRLTNAAFYFLSRGYAVALPMMRGFAASGGGPAELVDVGVVMKDSHQFLSYLESMPIWIPKLDGFLARIGMPSTMVNAAYLPVLFPPASRFATVTDVAAVPYLSEGPGPVSQVPGDAVSARVCAE